MAIYDDNMLSRLAKKIALSDGVPPDAIRSTGVVNKKIEVDDQYASKFADAIEKARSLLNDEGDK